MTETTETTSTTGTKPKSKTQGKSMEARNVAVRRLIKTHQAEYDSIVKEERIARGLPEVPTSANKTLTPQERVEKLRAKLRAAEEALNASASSPAGDRDPGGL